MSEPLEGDPFGIGLTGYTREEGEAILRGEPVGGVRLPEPDVAPRDFSCANRLDFIETGTCNLCGIKGQPFQIFGCTIHGKCSIHRKNTLVKSCKSCEERIPVALSEPTPVD